MAASLVMMLRRTMRRGDAATAVGNADQDILHHAPILTVQAAPPTLALARERRRAKPGAEENSQKLNNFHISP
jgi:hypothetical protein